MNKKTHMALAAMTMLGGLGAAPAFAEDAKQAMPAPLTGADGHFYAGAGINLYFIDKSDASSGMPIQFIDQPSPGAFVGRLGYSFNQYVAVEVQAGFGGAKSEYSDNGSTNGKIGVANPYGADVVLTLPFGQSGGYVLGRAGYGSVKVERELNGVDAPDLDISGADFGVGGGFRSDAWDFRMEYSMLNGDAKSGVLGMFVLRRF